MGFFSSRVVRSFKRQFWGEGSKDQDVHSIISSLPLLESDSAQNTSGKIAGWRVRKERSLLWVSQALLCRAGD